MQKIIKLDKNLINQISAWEVVERPSSVVKELIENSIDAGGKNIKIEITEWWKKEIIISDDGEWMLKEDLEICLEKYTTSKIKSLADLYNVLTFWFRWEALASISSVSDMSMISKTKDSLIAYKLEYNNEKWKIFTQSSHWVWTTIIVKNLFYNTPARLNYLKQDRTEYLKILSYLQNAVLSYPEIWFEFISDEKKIFKYNSNETLKTRIYEIYWNEMSDNLLEINFEMIWIKVEGYISDPKINFQNKSKQHIFVNKRPISSIIISKAISDAYNRFIPHGSFSAYILNIDIDPTVIDVNVHPRKSEIRFENEQNIFRVVYHAVLNKLEKVSLIAPPESNNNFSLFQREYLRNEGEGLKIPSYFTSSWTNFKEFSPYKNTQTNPNQFSFQNPPAFSHPLDKGDLKDNSFETWDLHYTKLWKIIGQAFNSYIIVENEWKIVMLDQHALAERIIFERLVKLDKKNSSQKLLIPESVKLSSNELSVIIDNKDIFENMWFEIEILWNSIISIYTIPNFVKKENLSEIILWIIEDLNSWNNLKSKTIDEIKNKIYAYTACRSAIKFWNKLNLFEMNKLLNDSVESYSSTCPHGRPVIYEIWLNELKGKYER